MYVCVCAGEGVWTRATSASGRGGGDSDAASTQMPRGLGPACRLGIATLELLNRGSRRGPTRSDSERCPDRNCPARFAPCPAGDRSGRASPARPSIAGQAYVNCGKQSKQIDLKVTFLFVPTMCDR